MKITGISIKNFRSHVDTRLEGFSRVSIISGMNGAGKSTILDAIAYAITGACRGITDGGVGAEGLVSADAPPPKRGKPNFTVELKTDRGDILRAGGQGPKSAMQAGIDKMLGVSGAKWCGVRPETFMGLEPDEQRELVMAVYGTEAADTVQVPANSLLTGHDLKTLSGIDAAEAHLRELRPVLKRQLADLPPAKAAVEVNDALITRGRQQMSALVKERDAIQADWNAKRFLKDQAKAEAERIQKALSGEAPVGDPAAARTRLAEGAARITELEAVDKQTAAAARKVEAEIASLTAEMSRLTATAERLRGVKGTCPTCMRAYTEDTRAKALSELKKQAATVNATLEAAKGKLAGLSSDYHAQEIADLRKSLAGLAESVGRDTGRDERIKGMQARLEEVLKTAALPIDDKAPTHDIETRIAAGQEWLEKNMVRLAEAKAASGIEDHRARLGRQLEEAESLIAYLGPQSPLRAALASGPTAAFLADVRPIVVAMGLPGLDIDAGWRMTVGARRIELLSTSEQYRLALAIACALSRKAGLGLLLLDNADVLDPANRAALGKALDATGLAQAIVATTAGPGPSVYEGEHSYYWVEKQGGISIAARIEQDAQVAS